MPIERRETVNGRCEATTKAGHVAAGKQQVDLGYDDSRAIP